MRRTARSASHAADLTETLRAQTFQDPSSPAPEASAAAGADAGAASTGGGGNATSASLRGRRDSDDADEEADMDEDDELEDETDEDRGAAPLGSDRGYGIGPGTICTNSETRLCCHTKVPA